MSGRGGLKYLCNLFPFGECEDERIFRGRKTVTRKDEGLVELIHSILKDEERGPYPCRHITEARGVTLRTLTGLNFSLYKTEGRSLLLWETLDVH